MALETDYMFIGRRAMKVATLKAEHAELVRLMIHDGDRSEYRLQQLGRIEIALAQEQDALARTVAAYTGL